nr:MAG TPA: hypothetical protein [Caudoviricetes sp.]
MALFSALILIVPPFWLLMSYLTAIESVVANVINKMKIAILKLPL